MRLPEVAFNMFSADSLVRLRKARGYSQEELARRSNLATATVAKIEEGRSTDPKTSTLAKLARGLGCSVEALLAEVRPTGTNRKSVDAR